MSNDTSLPLVSVVIPFYNCPYIDQAVSSVLSQTYPHLEIIVMDDGSTLHQEKLDPYRSSIHYFGKANGGTGSALNYAIRMARGEYIAWLSSDDFMSPKRIEIQLSYMQEHQALISCTDFHVINASNEVIEWSHAVKFPSAKQFIESLLTYCPINGSTVMLHRSVPAKIGWFDESLTCAQDYEYWIRVHLARIDFHYINEPLTLYRRHERMGTVQKKGTVDHEINLVRSRYGPQIQTLLFSL